MFEDLQLFIHVVDCGGVSNTAKIINMPLSTVSRRLTNLEMHLNLSLFYGDRRNNQLTKPGAKIYATFKNNFDGINQQIEDMKYHKKQISDELIIVMPPFFALTFFLDKLPNFLNEYPNILLRMFHTTAKINTIDINYDLAFTWLTTPATNLIINPIFDINMIICATPTYIANHGRPRNIDELSQHKVCIFVDMIDNTNNWAIKNIITGDTISLNMIKYQIATDIYSMIQQILYSGLSIAMVPDKLVNHEINQGTLVNLFPDYTLNNCHLQSVRPNIYKPKKVEAFESFVIKCIDHKL